MRANLHKAIRVFSKSMVFIILFTIIGGISSILNRTCLVTSEKIPLVTINAEKERTYSNADSVEKERTRPAVGTYLHYPEWYIVYSSQEYANCLAKGKPSTFPYFHATKQYWGEYYQTYKLTKIHNAFNLGDHFMLFVIGGSLSVEYLVKDVYENTIGRFTEWTAGGEQTEEDVFATKAYTSYVNFIPTYPFYLYHYGSDLTDFWRETSWWGPHMLRKWERKFIFTVEYGIKAIYGKLITFGTHTLYGIEGQDTYATVTDASENITNLDPRIHIVKKVDERTYFVSLPRYQAFSEVALKLANNGVNFAEIEGNTSIMISLLSANSWQAQDIPGNVVFTTPVLTEPGRQRVSIEVEVKDLARLLRYIQKQPVTLEHIYDY